MLPMYTRVRIKKLLHPDDPYNQWGINMRAPKVGETGFLIDVLYARDAPVHYVVENSDLDGTDIWLGEFEAEEIELESEADPYSA